MNSRQLRIGNMSYLLEIRLTEHSKLEHKPNDTRQILDKGPDFLWRDEVEWQQASLGIEANPESLEVTKMKLNLVEMEEVEICTDRMLKKYSLSQTQAGVSLDFCS